MKMALKRKGGFLFVLAMGILLILQLAVFLYYGDRKAGFHEDELYTYYSSNKTAGLFVNDRQWMERDDLRNEFVVLPGERFRYSVVKQMQSWDVHPPLYYYIFHTACSLVPGVFSKWTGIGVNLAAYVVCFFLLAWGVYMAVVPDFEVREKESGKGPVSEEERSRVHRRGKILAFLTCLGWGFGGAVISGVMFIRMYQWLTLFVLLCMDLHLRAFRKRKLGVLSFLLPTAFTVFLGFLTQYYYIIFHFFLGMGFCFLLLKNRRIRELLSYGVFCGLGLAGAVLYYPSSLAHIFRGYRGTEAVSEFGDVSNTWGRLNFFRGLFDDFMMNGTLAVWLLIICLLGVTVWSLKRITGGKKTADKTAGGGSGDSGQFASFQEVWPGGLLLFACGGYFFTVSKTALLLGETSNRYQLPIYGILLFLILWAVWSLTERLFGRTPVWPGGRWILAGMLFLALLWMDGLALKNGRVFFLYEQERDVMEFVRAHSRDPVVVFYNDASPDHIWRLSDELMEYDRVYLASQKNRDLIEDPVITESGSLLVYAADYEDKESCLEGILAVNKHLSSWKVTAEKGMWTLYELN